MILYYIFVVMTILLIMAIICCNRDNFDEGIDEFVASVSGMVMLMAIAYVIIEGILSLFLNHNDSEDYFLKFIGFSFLCLFVSIPAYPLIKMFYTLADDIKDMFFNPQNKKEEQDPTLPESFNQLYLSSPKKDKGKKSYKPSL